MKITTKDNRVLLTITKAELASNPKLAKVLKAQGFMGDSGAFDEPGVEEAYPESDHDAFMKELEGVFNKHGKEFTPEIKHHIQHGQDDSQVSNDPADHAPITDSPLGADTGGTSAEGYQDNSDPAHPAGGGGMAGQMGGNMVGIGGMAGMMSKSEETVKVASKKGLAKQGNNSDYMTRLIAKLAK